MQHPLDYFPAVDREYHYYLRYPAIFWLYFGAIKEAIETGNATAGYVYARMLARIILDYHTCDNHPVLDADDRVARLRIQMKPANFSERG